MIAKVGESATDPTDSMSTPQPNPYATPTGPPVSSMDIDLRAVEAAVHTRASDDLRPDTVNSARCLQSRVPSLPGIKFTCLVETNQSTQTVYLVTVVDEFGNFSIDRE